MPLSTTAIQAMFAQETSVAAFVFLTFYDPDFPEGAQPAGWPLRLVRHYTALTGPGGFTFSPALFDATLPDSGQNIEESQMTIQTIGADAMIDIIRSVTHKPVLRLQLATFNVENLVCGPVEMELYPYTLNEVEYEGTLMSFKLALDEMKNEPLPHYRFNLFFFPGLS